jgi:lipid-binding SYLF domain-containing protein
MKLSKVKGGYFAVATTCCLLITMGWAQDEKPAQTDIAKRLQAAAEVFQEIMQAPDKGIPDKILSDAKCITVIPPWLSSPSGPAGNTVKV